MFPSYLKHHMCKHGERVFECPCKDGPGGVPCGKKSNIRRCMNVTGKPTTFLKLNICLKVVQGFLHWLIT